MNIPLYKDKYTFVVSATPIVYTKDTINKIGYEVYAINTKTEKTTSIEHLSLYDFGMNELKEIKRVRDLLIKKIEIEKI